MKTRTYGGDAQLTQCGKNTVTGTGMAIDVDVRIKETKPRNPRPTKPKLPSNFPSKWSKIITKIVQDAQKDWDKKNDAWKASQKAAETQAIKAAKDKAKTIATDHMEQKMGAKSCLHPTCTELVSDKDRKAEDGVLLTSHVTDTHAYASASSDWTAKPECKIPSPPEEEKK